VSTLLDSGCNFVMICVVDLKDNLRWTFGALSVLLYRPRSEWQGGNGHIFGGGGNLMTGCAIHGQTFISII
jgi:hypothetical protein